MRIEYPERETLAQVHQCSLMLGPVAPFVLVAGANTIVFFLALGVLAMGRRQAVVTPAGA